MKQNWKRLIACLFSLLLAAVAFTGCGNQSSQDDSSLKGKKLTIGIGTYAPFSYQDQDGKQIGYDVDLLDALSKKLEFTYDLKVMEYDPMLISIQNKEIDMAAGQISITDERKQKIGFSDPYYYAGLHAAVKKDSSINSMDDLHGKKIAVEKGTAAHIYVTKNYSDSDIIVFPQQSAAYLEVEKGAADATLYDTPNVLYYLQTHADSTLRIAGEEVQKVPCGLAFPKDSKYISQINQALKELKDDGTIDKIQEKWLSTKSS
ncbi:transporter substrate-binding domain-containing protein [Pectinatus haikarae]|uniref:ABC-type amino acid transport substrate-binding protein n=1 Tax=Pectinatus haikarae TaxID=349096 RepID=A0ABT9Y4S3_9FIRM|nr:transporter substrate-binding domain-containing protein [Pectinatus haikarae]MDQ0202633.1 ABC-type amino acid transport substrate-binding protein [Pectinatus haikarae]